MKYISIGTFYMSNIYKLSYISKSIFAIYCVISLPDHQPRVRDCSICLLEIRYLLLIHILQRRYVFLMFTDVCVN